MRLLNLYKLLDSQEASRKPGKRIGSLKIMALISSNKIEGTPILKLGMVKDYRSKILPKNLSKKLPKISSKKLPKNSSKHSSKNLTKKIVKDICQNNSSNKFVNKLVKNIRQKICQ